MDKLEKVELVREKCGVTYVEAKDALEACNYDVLDAIVMLEKAGKTRPATASYTTTSQPTGEPSPEMSQVQREFHESSKKGSVKEAFGRFVDGIKHILQRSIEVNFVAERKDARIVAVPVIVLALLVLFAFWITLPLLVIGLFFGFRYSFEGIGKINVDINDVMDKVADGAESIKRDVMDAHDKDKDKASDTQVKPNPEPGNDDTPAA